MSRLITFIIYSNKKENIMDHKRKKETKVEDGIKYERFEGTELWIEEGEL